jgi:CheY-like chemotaxis protein
MEAVGRLAGGVAHDFNNLLTAIFNFGSFVLETLSEGDAAHEDMQQVLGAAQRAQNLTRQLLAFSRQQPINPRLVNSNTLVIDIEKLLRRLLGEDIDYATRLETDLWGIRIDPGAFEQVLVNLAINSRDAMPCGGRLVVGTSNVEVDEALAQALGFNAPLGQYMVLTVIDTGIGMDLETQKRIFDPFFTTKETGKGTGLGLATCYGIVKQAGGFIHVESEPNQGTTFKVFLPRFEQSPADQKGDSVIPTLKGTETILVVEDDRQVLEPTVRTLSHFGYRVLQASSGEDALRLCAAVPQPIHLLLSDIVMPKMSGPELVQHIAPRHPEMKVLYMSGYAGYGAGGRANASVPQAETLEKPFTPQILARRIREVLDSGK